MKRRGLSKNHSTVSDTSVETASSAERRRIELPRWVRNPTPLPAGADQWERPWVYLRYHVHHRHLYPAMIGAVSEEAKPGDLVFVYGKEGQFQGTGFYNPQARVPVRMVGWGPEKVDEARLDQLVEEALRFRLETLRVPEQSEAFRVIHSDGDGLSGLVVDRIGTVLSVEVHSLGIWQRLERWLPRLQEALGTRRIRLFVDPNIAALEGITPPQQQPVPPVRFREWGVRYQVNFEMGHKTGFFCDQRENRKRFAELVGGKRVLDVCCYTGGFALAAKVLGGAAEVTGVDLDERAIELAKKNANLNQVRIRWVHADAFPYLRQMQRNRESWDAIVLDPPKLIESRSDQRVGRKKYEDLNELAIAVLRRGGWLVTCSCSGLLPESEFEAIVIRAAHRQNRRLQIIWKTGAAADHPVLSDCLEGRYLKVLWTRVW